MDSVFEIIGPAMIGPSSSHTAGAVRIGLMGRALLNAPPAQAKIGLHGSFASTGAGHATDRGLVAGLLGFAPDDERVKDSLQLAPDAGLSVQFFKTDLGEQAHPNSARLDLVASGGGVHNLTASSIGGGNIEVIGIDEFPVSITGMLDALIMHHVDQAGFLAKVTAVLACVAINIATIRTSRHHRGENALTVIETDTPAPACAREVLQSITGVQYLRAIPRLP
ncbi:MAG: L-serine ammonia-lyase, iron-sulfur-dependent subunit beta [Verrucomicrobiae bacterium]|nr:L-serine ammonia-lyase, iron-sulfur-dependent subunit beta [Verrucomicrobiae bacterium]